MKWLPLFLVLSLNLLQADSNTTPEWLAKACRLGNLRMLESLLSAGVNPDLPDQYGKIPLYYAVAFDQAKAVELLLSYHADPNASMRSRENTSGVPATPLAYAVELDNFSIAERLVAAGAQVNVKDGAGRTALHFAVVGVHLDLIQFLIAKGANVNARDTAGASPLDDAVWRGSLNATAILLAHGAHINETETKSGATPINEAAYRGDTSLVQYLLQFKPDLGIPDKRGDRPLQNAIKRGKEEAALPLLEAEAKEQEAPEFLERTMDAAIGKDESLLVEALLRHGAAANGVLPSGYTNLNAASFVGATKVVQALLANGADPNVSGRDGTTPLEDSSLRGFEAIARMLLEHGASVNHLNSGSGTTALYMAASFDKAAVVKLLLERGARPNLCGRNRKTPYHVAVENGYKEVAAQIQRHGGTESCEQ